MTRLLRQLVLLFAAAAAPLPAAPLIIAHRGASGLRPEHTLASYGLAIDQGADFIEADLVMTRDHVLVARHENEIGGTTDVARHPEFASRRATRTIDGQAVTGWFVEDFTLAELRTLRARERLPELRPQSNRFDGRFAVPTLDEVIRLVAARNRGARRTVGLYLETKHPSYFRSIGLPLEEPLVARLEQAGYRSKTDPVFIESFEVDNLVRLRRLTRVRLVQLLDAEGHPADRPPGAGYAAMVTPIGLAAVAGYADGIGPAKALIVPRAADGTSLAPTALVGDAHRAGLVVHPWTFRSENGFLPRELARGTGPATHGDAAGEVRAFVALGVDGLFSDFPGDAVAAIRSVERGSASRRTGGGTDRQRMVPRDGIEPPTP
jgi:glycerophosphoryl diester phosphodiesterase